MKPLISSVVVSLLLIVGCRPGTPPTVHNSTITPRPVGTPLARTGDEIVVCGQYFHTGTPVVLWTDPGGYDAYRTERRFAPYDNAPFGPTTREMEFVPGTDPKQPFAPTRFGMRRSVLTTQQAEQVRGGGWPLELLQQKVDQFVIHYDVAGVSQVCFRVLHDQRNLSVQFMLDIDGTIYQTLDLKERAWHGGTANSRSVGIEIANMGAYPKDSSPALLKEWYQRLPDGRTRITVPKRLGDGGVRTPNFIGYPVRSEPVYGTVQQTEYRQYDFTAEQYAALTKLTAALCRIFPNMRCDYPRDSQGRLITHALTKQERDNYQGLLGHYHVINSKQDPGPAFQWDLLIDGARQQLQLSP